VDYLALLCRENLLLTLHRKSIMSLKNLSSLQDSGAWLAGRSIAGLVSAMMIDLSLGFLQHTAELRESVRVLDERMDRDPDAVEVEEILEIRSKFLALGAVVSDQLPSVKALSTTDKPFFKLADARDYMNCALANLLAAGGSLEWLDKQITDVRSGFQMHAQDKTNRRLNLLTILSAIFSPLSLLTGIWGMNFVNMPELQYAFSYPIALGLMGFISWGMLFYFRKTGWLD
jgi:Mg2+ and Co2+ transporter CorA